MVLKDKGRTRGTRRASRYGNLIEDKGVVDVSITTNGQKALPAAKVTEPKKTYVASKFTPYSDEVTPYGAKKFRTPVRKDEFTGAQGSAIPAYVLDIDGTLQGWGSSADKKVLAWAEKIYKANPDAVFLIVTARDHGSFGYEGSFNWLMHNFPYPFIGPFARPKDDPRFASEFKRELAQGFEDIGLYQIMGAADDNDWVIKMWQAWATEHFTEAKDFNLLQCSYADYGFWRGDLDRKGASSYTSYGTSYTDTHPNEHWENSKYVSDFRDGEHWVHGEYVSGVWVSGHWEADTTEAKHRSAGVSRWAKTDELPTAGGKPVTIANDPSWAAYMAKRERDGAYTGLDRYGVPDELDEALDEVIDSINAGYSVDRADLELIVAHDYPGYTPADLASMSPEELRELAGITVKDVREGLYVRIGEIFSGRYHTAELDELSVNELEMVAEMTVLEADEYMDASWEASLANRTADEAQFSDPRPPVGSYREILEEDVYAEYPDMGPEEIARKSDAELELLMSTADALRARFDAEATGPLPVVEVLTEQEVAS